MTRFRIILVLLAMAGAAEAQNFHEYLAKGDEFYSARKYKEAVSYFTLAIGQEPQNPKGYYYRGDANRELKEWEASIEDYTNAVDLDPKNAKYRRLRGDSFYDMLNYVRAEADYTKSIALDPTSATTWLYRGDTYEMLKQNDKACSDYQKAFELGSRNGKLRAVKLSCDWTRHLIGGKPCPTAESLTVASTMDALTGAVVLSRGMGYESVQLTTPAGPLTGPEFAEGETLTVRVTGIRDFCSETAGTIFAGTGYEIRENGGREVEKVHNTLPNDKSFTGEQANSLEITIRIAAHLSAEKQHLLTVHFFDTKGHAELFVELPFKTTKKTLAGKNPVTRKTIGNIQSAGIGGTIGGLDIHTKGQALPVAFDQLRRNSEYIATGTNVLNVNKHSHFIFRFSDETGTIVYEHKGKAVYEGDHVKLDFRTDGIPAGKYTLWLKVQEIDAPQSIGVSVPVVLK